MTDYTADDYAEACKALALGEPVQYRANNEFTAPWSSHIPPSFDTAKIYNWRAAPKPPKTKKLYPYAYKDEIDQWCHAGWSESPDTETTSRYSHSELVKINADGTIDVPDQD